MFEPTKNYKKQYFLIENKTETLIKRCSRLLNYTTLSDISLKSRQPDCRTKLAQYNNILKQRREISCNYIFLGDFFHFTAVLDYVLPIFLHNLIPDLNQDLNSTSILYSFRYIFSNNLVSARKILKEEKVWNFTSDNQVCLILFRQMPFLLFVHSDCNYDENTGDILTYDYDFGVFSFCKKQPDVKYTVSITLESDADNSHYVMKNQEVKPFNERLHLINFIRIGQ